jgi:hypothetical protein
MRVGVAAAVKAARMPKAEVERSAPRGGSVTALSIGPSSAEAGGDVQGMRRGQNHDHAVVSDEKSLKRAWRSRPRRGSSYGDIRRIQWCSITSWSSGSQKDQHRRHRDLEAAS